MMTSVFEVMRFRDEEMATTVVCSVVLISLRTMLVLLEPNSGKPMLTADEIQAMKRPTLLMRKNCRGPHASGRDCQKAPCVAASEIQEEASLLARHACVVSCSLTITSNLP